MKGVSVMSAAYFVILPPGKADASTAVTMLCPRGDRPDLAQTDSEAALPGLFFDTL